MSNFFMYLIEVSVCLATFYLLYAVAFSKQQFFQLNRWYLILGLLLSFIIPAIQFRTSVTGIPNMYGALLEQITVTGRLSESVVPSIELNTVIWLIYLSGVLILSIRFIAQLTGIVKLIRSATSISSRNGYTLVNIGKEEFIGSFFRYILFSNQNRLSEAEAQLVIDHEVVHARQGHSYDVMLFEMIGIILWFNPFVHLFKKAISVNHEYIADQAVAQSEPQEYINLIATQALSTNGIRLTSSFNSSQIINRIKMLKTNTTRSTITRYLLVTPVLLLLFAVFSCKTMTAPQEDPKPTSLDEETFTIVENQPTFPGGIAEYYTYVQENLKYPDKARKKEVSGKVFVQFVVDKSGEIRDTKVLKGIGYGCDEEALRVIGDSPNWIPGSQRGKNVNVRMVLPITFLSK